MSPTRDWLGWWTMLDWPEPQLSLRRPLQLALQPDWTLLHWRQ
jgi:hypothetical protein